VADYSKENINNPEIQKLLDDYFDVSFFQDMGLFDKVFQKDGVFYPAQGGELSIKPYQI